MRVRSFCSHQHAASQLLQLPTCGFAADAVLDWAWQRSGPTSLSSGLRSVRSLLELLELLGRLATSWSFLVLLGASWSSWVVLGRLGSSWSFLELLGRLGAFGGLEALGGSWEALGGCAERQARRRSYAQERLLRRSQL